MKKDGRKKLMPILVTAILLLSLLTAFGVTSDELRIQGDKGDLEGGDQAGNTPGDPITIRVTDGGLTYDQTYSLTGWNADTLEHKKLYRGSAKADVNGDIAFETRIPGWSVFGNDPIGTQNLSLWEGNPPDPGDESNLVDTINIEIDNYFKVKMFVNGEEVSYLYRNLTYGEDYGYTLLFKIYNYTGGTSYDLVDDLDLTVELWHADETQVDAEYVDDS